MEDVTVVDVPSQLVLGIRKKGKYELISKLLPKAYEYAVSMEAEFAGPPVFICNEKTVEDVKKADEEGTADIQIAIPIVKEIEVKEDFNCYILKGGTMAKITHKGPYDQCGSIYEKLFDWIEKNNKALTGPTREVYLNDPREVKPEEILTDIYAPIC